MKKQMHTLMIIGILIGSIGFINAKSFASEAKDTEKSETQAEEPVDWRATLPNSILTIGDETVTIGSQPNPLRNAYFGDTHVHTTYSFDAFVFGTLATPDDAYRYAKGEAIKHPGGFDAPPSDIPAKSVPAHVHDHANAAHSHSAMTRRPQ